VKRKPPQLGFICTLCEQQREYWEVAYRNDLGTWLCNKCTLDGINRVQGPNYYGMIKWIDQVAVEVARGITHELKNGRRYARTIDGGNAESGGANYRARKRSKGIAGGEDIDSRSSRASGVGPTGASRGPLHCNGSEVHRRAGEADITRINALTPADCTGEE